MLQPLNAQEDRTQVSPFTEISILFSEGTRNFLWVSRLWLGRRKKPILGYVPKNDEKNNLVYNGLKQLFCTSCVFNYN